MAATVKLPDSLSTFDYKTDEELENILENLRRNNKCVVNYPTISDVPAKWQENIIRQETIIRRITINIPENGYDRDYDNSSPSLLFDFIKNIYTFRRNLDPEFREIWYPIRWTSERTAIKYERDKITFNNIKLIDFTNSILSEEFDKLKTILGLSAKSDFTIAEYKNPNAYKRAIASISDDTINNNKNTLLRFFTNFFNTYIKQLYEAFYLAPLNDETKYILRDYAKDRKNPNKTDFIPGKIKKDLTPNVYKIYYATVNIIKQLTLLCVGPDIVALNGLLEQNPDASGNDLFQPPADKVAAVNHYNALTAIFKEAGFNKGDPTDVSYTRSHFFDAINQIYGELEKRNPVLHPIDRIQGVRETSVGQPVPRPLHGGLRYGSRRFRQDERKIEV